MTASIHTFQQLVDTYSNAVYEGDLSTTHAIVPHKQARKKPLRKPSLLPPPISRWLLMPRPLSLSHQSVRRRSASPANDLGSQFSPLRPIKESRGSFAFCGMLIAFCRRTSRLR